MEKNMDYTLMYRVAKAYYIDQRTQQEIADVENFSRSQVSRLLKRALEERLVTYKMDFPGLLDEAALADQLKERLHLDRVVLVPSFFTDYAQVSNRVICKNLAMGAAEKLPDILEDAEVVGVGWGRSVYTTSLNLKPQKPVPKQLFVPLIGYLGDSNPALQINTIVDRFGQCFNAARKYINFPSLQILQSYDPKSSPLRALYEKWETLDAAIVGIGAAPANDPSLLKEFPAAYRKKVLDSTARGDILAQFFTADGGLIHIDDSTSNVHLMALELEKLKQVPNVIGMAAGTEKCQAITIAAKMGYIKTLITDYNTAQTIIDTKE